MIVMNQKPLRLIKHIENLRRAIWSEFSSSSETVSDTINHLKANQCEID